MQLKRLRNESRHGAAESAAMHALQSARFGRFWPPAGGSDRPETGGFEPCASSSSLPPRPRSACSRAAIAAPPTTAPTRRRRRPRTRPPKARPRRRRRRSRPAPAARAIPSSVQECVQDVQNELPAGTDVNAFCNCAVAGMAPEWRPRAARHGAMRGPDGDPAAALNRLSDSSPTRPVDGALCLRAFNEKGNQTCVFILLAATASLCLLAGCNRGAANNSATAPAPAANAAEPAAEAPAAETPAPANAAGPPPAPPRMKSPNASATRPATCRRARTPMPSAPAPSPR